MKRTAGGDAVDLFHPQVAFHREVLIAEQWALIRSDFLTALNSRPRVVVWQEPKKLWRYSQEALGKWLLSQVARVPREEDMRALFFFPSARVFDSIPTAQCSAGRRSYDEQLIRDLTLKSNGVSDAAAVAAVREVVSAFDLAKRCAEAEADVSARMQQLVSYRNAYAPVIRRVDEDDAGRTPSQKRIHGPLIEVKVHVGQARLLSGGQEAAPNALPPKRTGGRGHAVPRVVASIPLAAWEKLLRAYAHVSAEAEAAQYPHLPKEALAAYRAATVALRYEATLSTGSLQLCADTSLKQHLHASGYHVIDLCASPINAYMGRPKVGSFAGSDRPTELSGGSRTVTDRAASAISPAEPLRPSSLEEEAEHSNVFCSAFYDTDRFFGSLGSALHVDPIDLYRSATVNGMRQPLLLTLDVPYDEDLCEGLFQKLVCDMQRQEHAHTRAENGAVAAPVQVDYVLVLPIWWDVPIPITKRYFTDASTPGSEEEAAMVRSVLASRTAMLNEGYPVKYTWPEDLGKACTSTLSGRQWACFDGLFVGGQYSYFCTATNRWLRGVTATEVIGLAQPNTTNDRLRDALKTYYGSI